MVEPVTLREGVVFFVSLFSLFSPPATIGPVVALVGSAARADQRRVAVVVARNYAIIILLSLWTGHYVLELLGIAPAALTVAGALALAHQGWPLMSLGSKGEPHEHPFPEVGHGGNYWLSLAVVPLTFPVTIGGASVALALSAAARFSSLTDLLALSALSLAMAMVVGVTFLLAAPVSGRLGVGAVDVLARVSGIILLSLAIQEAVSGLGQLIVAVPALHSLGIRPP